MSDTAPTGEIKFGREKTGLFIAHEDLPLYLSALRAVREGRSDAICIAAFNQLVDLMTQADDDETTAVVQICRSFDDCRMTEARLDALMRT